MTASERIRKNCGYLTTPKDTADLIAENPLQTVLVRMGSGRFVCSVQDLDHMIAMVVKSDLDYVRDVSLR